MARRIKATAGKPARSRSRSRSRSQGQGRGRRAPYVAVALLAVGVLVVIAVLLIGQEQVSRPPSPRQRAVPVTNHAVQTLHDWDAARARAWAKGDVPALRDLYVARSAAGQADVRLLRRYLARGLVVRRARTQVFRVRVVRASEKVLRLEVVDRFAGGVAVSGDRRTRLPGAAATTHTLVLRSVAGRWRMATVLSARPSEQLRSSR